MKAAKKQNAIWKRHIPSNLPYDSKSTSHHTTTHPLPHFYDIVCSTWSKQGGLGRAYSGRRAGESTALGRLAQAFRRYCFSHKKNRPLFGMEQKELVKPLRRAAFATKETKKAKKRVKKEKRKTLNVVIRTTPVLLRLDPRSGCAVCSQSLVITDLKRINRYM